jgi:hypothetical protein
MPRGTIALRLISLVILLLLAVTVNAMAAPAGSVVGISGQCVVERAGTSSPLAIGQPVQVGDTVDVPAGGKLKLRMSDGSIVSLAENTHLTVTSYNVDSAGKRQDGILSLGQGLLHAVVAPVSPPARFEVNTAVGVAAVRSTDWFIEVQEGSDQIGVLTGSVNLTSAATGHSVTIPEGFGSRLGRGRDPLPPRHWSRQEFDTFRSRTERREAPRHNPPHAEHNPPHPEHNPPHPEHNSPHQEHNSPHQEHNPPHPEHNPPHQ